MRWILVATVTVASSVASANDTVKTYDESCILSTPSTLCVMNVGGESLAGRTNGAGDFDGGVMQVLVGKYSGVGRVRPSISFGLVFAGGELTPPAARATMPVDATYQWFQVGPEAQLGLELFPSEPRHGLAGQQDRVYVSIAPVYSTLSGSSASVAERFAIGGNWIGSQGRLIDAASDGEQHSLWVMLLLLPQNVEFLVQHDRGALFTGAALTWGI